MKTLVFFILTLITAQAAVPPFVRNRVTTNAVVNESTNPGRVLTTTPGSGVAWSNAPVTGASSLATSNATVLPLWYDINSTTLRFYGLEQGSNVVLSSTSTSIVVNASTPNTFDNIVLTNGVNHIRKQVNSTLTTNQINVATGPQYYFWTNMVTNVVLQITNTWSIGVTNRTLDFFFTGATNTGPNYTVTFTCPNPSGFVFRWGLYSITNGGTSFTITNNMAAGASITFWETNLAECYFSPVR